MGTIIQGNAGSVSVTGHGGAEITQFTFMSGANLIPTPVFGAAYEKFTKGLKKASGTAVAWVSKGEAGTNPFDDGDGSIVLTFDTGCTVTMNVIVGDVQVQNSADGVPVATFSFAHSDDAAPVVVWAEGT